MGVVEPSNRSVILAEFHFNLPDARSLWEESTARLATALTNFVTSPELERFRRGAAHPGSLIEKNLRLREEHFSLKGQIDFAYPEGGRFVILDWKLGAAGGGEDSLQLLSYALVATKHFGCAPESLDLFKVHLEDGTVSSYTVREEEIRRARARIIQDSQQMQAVDHYGRNGVAAAFTPCGQPRICAMCPFQQFCAKGVAA
jgi:CRISPR/Cas system-associated exonuclease Cas4 (RecB family)